MDLAKLSSVCWDGTTAGAAMQWHQEYPNLELFGGFSTRSPLGTTVASPAILKRFLMKEKKLENEKDSRELLKMVKNLNVEKINKGLAVMVHNCYVSVADGTVSSLSKALESCKGKISKLSIDSQLVYQPYTNGKKQVPLIDNDTTDIRKFYKEIQDSIQCLPHCSKKNVNLLKQPKISEEIENRIPCPSEIIKVIRIHDVKRNFERYFKKELNELQVLLTKEKNLSEECKNILGPQWPTMEHILANRGNALTNCIKQIQDHETAMMFEIQSRGAMEYLMGNCAPFDWIEDESSPSDPSVDSQTCKSAMDSMRPVKLPAIEKSHLESIEVGQDKI